MTNSADLSELCLCSLFTFHAIIPEKSFTDANAELQAEAERIVKIMPKWNPGKKDGKRVRVGMTIPINFLLE